MIPTSITSIGEYAISGCTKLATVSYPVSVKTSATNIFEGCNGMKTLNIIGSGEMFDFKESIVPWIEYKNDIKNIIIIYSL